MHLPSTVFYSFIYRSEGKVVIDSAYFNKNKFFSVNFIEKLRGIISYKYLNMHFIFIRKKVYENCSAMQTIKSIVTLLLFSTPTLKKKRDSYTFYQYPQKQREAYI